MEKLLNCSDIDSTYSSVANILGIENSAISNFIVNNQHRFTINKYGYREYTDRLTLSDILNSFNITVDQIDFDYLVVQHVAAIYDRNSFLTKGLMSIRDLFMSDNSVRSKLKEYGLNIGERANGELYIERGGKSVITDYLKHRLERDRCINGFLTWYDAETDSNVRDIRRCPEIVAHIGKEILNSRTLEEDWIQNAQPSIISFKVTVEEIQEINYVPVTKEHLLLCAIDCLLKCHAQYDDYQKIMIFLRENLSVDGSRIIEIRAI